MLAGILTCAFLYACTGKEQKSETVAPDPIDSSVFIKGPVAIFIGPDSIESDSLKNILGEDDFYTIADDYVYYLAEARHLLDSAGIQSFNSEEDSLKFMTNGGQIFSIAAKDTETIFPVYFFNGMDAPVKVEVMDDYKGPFEKIFHSQKTQTNQ